MPTAPAHPELFAELTELLGLGSSADRVLASLAGAAGVADRVRLRELTARPYRVPLASAASTVGDHRRLAER